MKSPSRTLLVGSRGARRLRVLLAGALALTGCELAFSAGDLDSTSGDDDAGAAGAPGIAGSGGAGGGGGEPLGVGGGAGTSSAVTCECLPEETQIAPCGRCGSQLRVCRDDCTWGLFGQCSHEGVCTGGETEDEPCGNCGSGKKTRLCDPSCQWGDYGACDGESGCTPGSTKPGPASCDPCDVLTCEANCQWSGCGLEPGKQCEWKSGKNYRCCGAGKWQFCSSTTCDFFACAPCPNPATCPC